MDLIRKWFQRHFSDPQVVILTVLLVGFAAGIILLGRVMAPVIAAVVLAYLLEGLVNVLLRAGVPRLIAVWLVFTTFMALLLAVVFGLLPLVWRQSTQLVQQVPFFLGEAQNLLLRLPEQYPHFITHEQASQFMTSLRSEVLAYGQRLLAYSVSSVVAVVTLVVYLVLVPFLVLFFIKDKDLILGWIGGFLPTERHLSAQVWAEVNAQIGNYVRGKFWEIVIVGVASFLVFFWLGLDYALLLAVLTGLSVLIPYVGAAVVTIPVGMVAYAQWGWSPEFVWALIAYGIIQLIDGNVLAPLLFSEAVNLHPVAIIVAIFFFGGLWGFWGVFFAIPLATVVKAVIGAWPRTRPPPSAPPSDRPRMPAPAEEAAK